MAVVLVPVQGLVPLFLSAMLILQPQKLEKLILMAQNMM
jgi:hypothetical protein